MKGDMDVSEFKRFLERIIEVEFSWTKQKTGYFKRVAVNCKRIINESTPRDIIINTKQKPDAKNS